MNQTTFSALELSVILELLDQHMPKGYRMYDFGGGVTVRPVFDKNDAFLRRKMIGIERVNDHKVQYFELYVEPEETNNV